jgi:S1-C subfamily serine protease
MEQMTKHQLILTALLVSFVTSIATGIITVSLVNQAPPAVTQTVNRVVEKTIERVVPEKSQSAAVITKETVVLKQEDLTIEAVEKNARSLVRIKGVIRQEADAAGGLNDTETRETLLGVGVIISKEGAIITDRRVIAKGDNYSAVLSDGKTMPLKIAGSDEENGIILFLPIKDPEDKDNHTFAPAVIGDSDKLRLGQTAVALSGKERNTVSLGIISSLINKEMPVIDQISGKVSTIRSVHTIETDSKGNNLPGSVLLDLNGAVVGFSFGGQIGVVGDSGYLATNVVKAKIPALLEAIKGKAI